MHEEELYESSQEYLDDMAKLESQLDALQIIKEAVLKNGVSREMVVGLEDIEPGIVTNTIPLTAFTTEPSAIFEEVAVEGIGEGFSKVLSAIGTAIRKAYKSVMSAIKRIARKLFGSKVKPHKVNLDTSAVDKKNPPKVLTEAAKATRNEGTVELKPLSTTQQNWVRENDAAILYAEMIKTGWWNTFSDPLDRYILVNYDDIIKGMVNAPNKIETIVQATLPLLKHLNAVKDALDNFGKNKHDGNAYDMGEIVIRETQNAISELQSNFEQYDSGINEILGSLTAVPGMDRVKEKDWTESDIDGMLDIIPGTMFIKRLKALTNNEDVGYSDSQLPDVDLLEIANKEIIDFSGVVDYAESKMGIIQDEPAYMELTQKPYIQYLPQVIYQHVTVEAEKRANRTLRLIAVDAGIRRNLATILMRYIEILKRVMVVQQTAVKFIQEQGPKIAAAKVV